jgi:hypothetical protein
MKTISKGSIIQIIYNGVSIESDTLDCYSVVIEKLIRDKYSVSQVEAIVNNYLLDNTNEEYLKEFNDMQEWRKEAKSIAKKVINFIQENDLINKPDGIYEIKD